MAANFEVRFIVDRVSGSYKIRITDTSTGFTLAKANTKITFPDGYVIENTDVSNPDISSVGGYIEKNARLDVNNKIKTGGYTIKFTGYDASDNEYTSQKQFNFSWQEPTLTIQDLSDGGVPIVKFKDATSWSQGSFTQTATTRTLNASYPTTSAQSGESKSGSQTDLSQILELDMAFSDLYYEGVYSLSLNTDVLYSHTNGYLTVQFKKNSSQSIPVKRVPTQTQLVNKLNLFKTQIDTYKVGNPSVYAKLSEVYDNAIALYAHSLSRYRLGIGDGAQDSIQELLNLIDDQVPHIYQAGPMSTFIVTEDDIYDASVTKLEQQIGTFDADGNLTSISLAFAQELFDVDATDFKAEVTRLTTLLAQFGTINPSTGLFEFSSSADYFERVKTYADTDSAAASKVSSLATNFGSFTGDTFTLSESAMTSIVDSLSLENYASTSSFNSLTSTVSNKPNVFRQDNPPSTTGLPDGCIWFDTNDNNKSYVLSSGSWVATDDSRLVTIPTIFRQDDEPTTVGIAEGSLWYDTNDSNKLYVLKSGSWTVTIDPRIATNASNISTLSDDLDAAVLDIGVNTSAIGQKPNIYRQNSAPTGTIPPLSIWYDTDDNNKAYAYVNSAWVSVEDARVGTLVTSVATAEDDIDTLTTDTIALASRATTLEGQFSFTDGEITGVADALSTSISSAASTAAGAVASDLDKVEAVFSFDGSGNVTGITGSLSSAVTTHATTAITNADLAAAADVTELKTQYTFDGSGNITGVADTLASTITTARSDAESASAQKIESLASNFFTGYDSDDGTFTAVSVSTAFANEIFDTTTSTNFASTSSVNTLTSTVNSKPNIYNQNDAPSIYSGATQVIPDGSIWYDTNDNNKVYIVADNGSGTSIWTEVADSRIVTNANSISTVSSNLSTTNSNLSAEADKISELRTQFSFDANGNITGTSDTLSTEITTAQSTATSAATSKVESLAANFFAGYDAGDGTYTSVSLSDAVQTAISSVVSGDGYASASDLNELTVTVEGSDGTGGLVGSVATNQSTIAARPKIFRQGTTPATTEPVGSLWFDTDDNNKPYVLVSGTPNAWTETRDEALVSGIASKPFIFRQDEPPATSNPAGSLWYDTNDGNKPYILISSTWTEVRDATIATAQSAANTAQSTADSRPKVFRQDDAPATTEPEFSIWYDTNDNNLSYVLLGDGGDPETFTWTETIDGRVTDLLDFVESKYSLTVDANGVITGLELYSASGSNTTQSVIKLTADKFVIRESSTDFTPFTLTGEQLKLDVPLNGVSGTFSGDLVAAGGTFTGSLRVGTTNTSVTDVVSGAAAGATANQDSTATILSGEHTGSVSGNVTGTVDGVAAGTIKTGAAAGATAKGVTDNLTSVVDITSSDIAIVLENETKAFNDDGTPFYVDNTGQFSLGDKLSYDPSTNTLSITGAVTIESVSGLSKTDVGLDNVDNTSVANILDGSSGAFDGNVTGTVDGTAAGTVKSGAAAGAAAKTQTDKLTSVVTLTNSDIAIVNAEQTKTFYDAGTPFYVDNTGDFSLGNKLKYDNSENLLTISGAVTIESVSGLSKSDVGLSNVDNTSVADILDGTAGDFTGDVTGTVDGTSATTIKTGAAAGSTAKGETDKLTSVVSLTNSDIAIVNSGTKGYNTAGTPFYVDNTGKFSLGNKLTFSGSTLAINGQVSSTSGNIGGWLIDSSSIKSPLVSSVNNLQFYSTASSGLIVRDSEGDTSLQIKYGGLTTLSSTTAGVTFADVDNVEFGSFSGTVSSGILSPLSPEKLYKTTDTTYLTGSNLGAGSYVYNITVAELPDALVTVTGGSKAAIGLWVEFATDTGFTNVIKTQRLLFKQQAGAGTITFAETTSEVALSIDASVTALYARFYWERSYAILAGASVTFTSRTFNISSADSNNDIVFIKYKGRTELTNEGFQVINDPATYFKIDRTGYTSVDPYVSIGGKLKVDGDVEITGNVNFSGEIQNSDVTVENLRDRLGELDANTYIGKSTGITVTVRENLIVEGDLTVNGTTVTVNTTNLSVADNLIHVGNNNNLNTVDLGIVGHYSNDSGTTANHVGMFWDASATRWKFFDAYTKDELGTTTVDTAHASFSLGDVEASTLYATSFIKSGGTSSQFLKADGSVDSSTYLTTSGKAADSNLLDGIDSSQFLRSDANDTATGSITFSGGTTRIGNGGYDLFINGGVMLKDYSNAALTNGRFYFDADAWYFRGGGEGEADTTTNTTMYIRHSDAFGEVWHSRNDGSGSGLDADLLDSKHATDFNLQYITDNNASTTNSITATSFVKTGGTSSQFLKADGSVDSTAYTKYIDLTTQVQLSSYRKSVIALCDVDNTSIDRNSYSIGTLTFHRTNGLSSPVKLDIAIEKRYNSTGTNVVALGIGGDSFVDNIQYVTFDYNGNTYGGIEFYFTAAQHHEVTFYGRSNFDIFGLDYYNVSSGTALNTEVNNSISTTNVSLETDFYFNNNAVWHAGNDGSGSGLDADTIDGLQASQFLRIDTSNTMSGNLTFSGDSRYIDLSGGTTSSQNALIIGEQNLYGVRFRWDSGSALQFDGYWNSSTTGTENRDLGYIDVDNRIWYLNQRVEANESLRAPIFYDSNDTSYYINPNSTSNINVLQVVGDIRGTGQQLVLNAGESAGYFTGQTGEYVYVNSENGLQVNSSPDNWSSGWAGRYTTTIGNSSGDSVFPNNIYVGSQIIHNGDTDTYIGFTADTQTFRTGGSDRMAITSDVHIQGATDLNINGTSRRLNFTAGTGTVRTTTANNLILQANNTTRQTLSTGGYSEEAGSYRAPIFYDSDDTSYFLNAAGTSNINTLVIAGSLTIANRNWAGNIGTGENYVASSSSTSNRGNYGAGIWAYSGYSTGTNRPHTYDATIQIMPDSSRGFELSADWLSQTKTPLKIRSLRDCCQGWSDWTEVMTAEHSNTGNFITAGSMRAGVFYETLDTNYYVDPANTSMSARLAGRMELIGTAPVIEMNDSNATNTTDQIAFISYQINGTESGFIGYGSASNSYFYVRNTNGIIYNYGTYTLHANSSRAPIFYDSDDTTYYVNAASDSVFNTITVVGGVINMNNNDGFVYDDGTNTMKVKYDGTEYAIWTTANDGSGGGLDADLLDGQHGTYYDHRRYTDSTNYLGGYYVSGGGEKPNSSVFGAGKLKIAMLRGGSGQNLGFSGTWNDVLWISTYTGSDVKRSSALVFDKYDNTSVYIVKQNYDATDWGTGYLFWNSGNDGSGSGLDADLLDGVQGASYLRSDVNDTYTGTLTVTGVVNVSSQLNAPIFYDSDNTNYYINPTGLSYINEIRSNEAQANPRWDTAFYVLQAQHWYGDNSSQTMFIGESGNYVNLRGSLATPIVYDYNNTNRYLDPSSLSVLTRLNLYTDTDGEVGLNIARASSTGRAQMQLLTESGSALWRFGATGPGSSDFAFFDGSNNVLALTSGYAIANASMRAPIFYDSDNTAYYLDAGSTSRLNQIDANYLDVVANNAYGVRFWGGSANYKIAMSTSTDTTNGGRISGETTSDYNMYFTMAAGTNRGFVFRNANASSGCIAGIDASGNARFAGDVIAYASSDKRLKDNIKPIENALDKVQQISGVTFDWNDKQDTFEEGMHDIGVIAQEVEAIAPEIVNTRENGYKAVKYEKLVPLLIEAIKEQQKEIDQLKSIINKS